MYITLFMTKYLNRLCAAIIIAASTAACTEVDDRLGAGLLPKNQQMEIEMKTLSNGVKTYLYREDSIPSSRTGYAWFGRMNDDRNVFGAQTNSVLMQFLPLSVPYANAAGFGIDPIIDSMCIVLSLDDVRGDTTQVQKFDVYNVVRNETRGVLDRSNVYYNNFPINEYKGEKLFSFSHTGKRSVRAKLFPTAAGREYLESIVAMKSEEDWKIFKDDSLFRAKYQGLYITPADDSPSAAAVYAADLASSGLLLYVRNHDSLDVTAIYDTIVNPFSFADSDITATQTSSAVSWDNVSVNMTAFDYTNSAFQGVINDTLATSTPLDKVYVQAMAGVGTYMRFTDELIDQIRDLGGDDVDIMINQAMMHMYLDGDVGDYRVLDRAISRLGSYNNIKYLYPIPDYQYSSEVAYQQQDATYKLPYNGWLNRSNGYYEFDITSYIQQLAKERDGDPGYRRISPVVFLAPEAYSMYSFGTSTLKGYVENPTDDDRLITIRLTYTIIKGKPTQ